ncbi:uncharacterized protein LOC132797656 [Drosophila nasuta]|uniref:uncharacterized protein LOC132797656 n=1 Tax=Drosophila nasuta TaxID=42062 RepID=UPI00295E39DB|nr:uncharacterized protein LOC132797656 [Drosophila nasuta]
MAAQKGSESSNDQADASLNELVRRFWEVESCEYVATRFSREQQDCEKHFRKNVTRLPSGEYSARLPMKSSVDSLGESYTQAHRRFLNLERKLQRHPDLRMQYSSFIEEYLKLNHMSRVPAETIERCKYFLPHHCVLKADSTTTKLRVVFDGSAATSTGYSLNEVMMAGPVIQGKLMHILLRFRTYLVPLTGDICKMYRCVRMASADSYYQYILWRDSPNKELQIFKLDTVTYGTKAASFLSVRAMHQLAHDEAVSFPVGSVALKNEFYVDDFISGGDSVAEVKVKLQETAAILARANFKLRKWCSSHAEVLSEIVDDEKESYMRFSVGSEITKTLGLAWDPSSDRLLFSLSFLEAGSKPCRWSVLATIARFYDPLGLLGPVMTKSKIFLQQLCKDKLTWDESLPLQRYTAWVEMCSSFNSISSLSFPRAVPAAGCRVEVHGFCDASEEAYGACVYVVSSGRTSQSRLLCSKSRVAPLKTISVPKLELCGAYLLAKLLHAVRNMGFLDEEFFCWSDSSVVLSWIKDDPYKFNVFVANRVASIQDLTVNMKWQHVATALNPADVLSRGTTPECLAESKIWFHGPEFLAGNRDGWPSQRCLESSTLEMRSKVMIATSPYDDITLRCKYLNTFASMQRVYAFVFKFVNRIKHPGLNVVDVNKGTWLLLRLVQLSNLWSDVKEIRSKGFVKKSSSIASLLPFIDQFGLLRVGGRLANSTLPYDARHPIILPRRHPITLALIAHHHKNNLHVGARALLAKIRLQYWPIGGLRTVSKVVRNCIECFRAKPTVLEPIMASLPKERFLNSHPPIKCYISVFICFASNAIHLELVKDLTTAAFLGALKRFVSLRGRPNQIWSDNATLSGPKNELHDVKKLLLSDPHKESVHRVCLMDNIEWKFIPPRSPHFGGLREAAVKSAKHHLYRSVGRSILNYDELRTLVCQIAAIINSRPLLSISESPDDLDVLTPAHLLFGGPPTVIFEPDLSTLDYNRLDGWQRVTQLQQVFWNRWREEYLTLLQQRSKWRTPDRRLQVNDVVLMKDENLPPFRWCNEHGAML